MRAPPNVRTDPPLHAPIRLYDEAAEHVEREIYLYHETVKALRARRAELLDGPPDPHSTEAVRVKRPKGWDHADPTHFHGTAIAMDERMREMERITTAIETVYAALPTHLRACMALYYWSKDGPQQVADTLAVSRPTLRRYRLQIVTAVGSRLGWLECID